MSYMFSHTQARTHTYIYTYTHTSWQSDPYIGTEVLRRRESINRSKYFTVASMATDTTRTTEKS